MNGGIIELCPLWDILILRDTHSNDLPLFQSVKVSVPGSGGVTVSGMFKGCLDVTLGDVV